MNGFNSHLTLPQNSATISITDMSSGDIFSIEVNGWTFRKSASRQIRFLHLAQPGSGSQAWLRHHERCENVERKPSCIKYRHALWCYQAPARPGWILRVDEPAKNGNGREARLTCLPITAGASLSETARLGKLSRLAVPRHWRGSVNLSSLFLSSLYRGLLSFYPRLFRREFGLGCRQSLIRAWLKRSIPGKEPSFC